MTSGTSQAMYDRVFKLIALAACSGERCPQMSPHGVLSPGENLALLQMARAGRVKIEIFAHNWRVVTICEGEHKGKHTKLSPYRGSREPYRTIQKGDVPKDQRTTPSYPRHLAPFR